MEERPDLYTPLQQLQPNKRANSHNFKIKDFNLFTITFFAIYLLNRDKSSYIN